MKNFCELRVNGEAYYYLTLMKGSLTGFLESLVKEKSEKLSSEAMSSNRADYLPKQP
jgi:hypothetical protein